MFHYRSLLLMYQTTHKSQHSKTAVYFWVKLRSVILQRYGKQISSHGINRKTGRSISNLKSYQFFEVKNESLSVNQVDHYTTRSFSFRKILCNF